MHAVWMAGLLVVAVPDRPDRFPVPQAKPLQEQLLGDWQQVKRIVNGNDHSKFENLTLAFTREAMQHVHFNEGKRVPATLYPYVLDTTKSPAVISFRDAQYEGILKIEGDVLTICYGRHGETQPPTQFDSPANSSTTLLQATRIKR